LGQPTVDTTGLPTIGAKAYTDAYGNAAKVLELFGAPDATADTIKYKITNSWQEGEDSFTEISFFAADSSIKLGLMFVDERSWNENNETISSTNINFDSVDQNGQLQWIAGSYTNYAGEILRDSGSNSRTTKAVADLTDVPNEIDLTGYTDVIVEISINTRFDPQGNPSTWEVTRYFEEGDNGQFLGEIGIGSDGFTRVIDRDGKGYESNSNNPDNGEGNNEPWTTIETDTYTLDLPPASWGGWNLQVKGTGESETLDLAAIALEQDLAADGINVDAIYTGISGAGGNDKLYGAGGMDSLRVHFDGSNLVDGRTNPSYLGSDGDFFSAHDRYVIFQDVTSREEWYQGDYVLLGVDAIVAQSAGNADVALKDLATSDALQIDSVVNLMSGELEDMSQLLSLLSQIAEKAVSLGIGDMPLGDLTSLMMKVQSVSLEDQSLTIEVDFIKDIDMVTVVGVLEDGSDFTADQVFINPVEYTLADDDNFSNPFSLGVRGSYQGTNASDQVDRSGENSGVGYSFRMGDGDDVVVGTDYDDVINLQGGGTKTIDGGLGTDAADINIIGMWDDGGGYGLNVQFDEQTGTYTVFDSFADRMDLMLTVSADNETGVWTAESTVYGKAQFNLADANLTNVESIRIFIGTDPNKNNEAVYRTLDLTVDKIISTETYTLDLRYASFGISVIGTDGSDVLNLSEIALAQNLANDGIDVSTLYNRLDGGMGDDRLTGSQGADSLQVSFDGSNFLDGRSNPAYLGSDGDFFSAHDRFVVNHDVGTKEELSLDNYSLLSVRAIEAQDSANGAVLLKDLGSSDALTISSVVNLITGELEDLELITSMLSQVSAKAVSLGIGDMALDELDGLLIKIQSVQADGQIIDVDFLKDIDMLTIVGQLSDGNSFVATQSMINPIEYTLTGDDEFANIYSLGVRGAYLGTNASETIDLSTAGDSSAGYAVYPGMGDGSITGTKYADIINLQAGDKNIDGGDGVDVLDITSYLNDGHNLTVNFDSADMTYTVFDTTEITLNDGTLSYSDKLLFTAAPQENGSWRVESSDWGKDNFTYLGDATLNNIESIRVFHAFDNNEPVYQALDLVGVMPVQNG
ncbi:hypothetical protein N9L89_07900, partial [Gammaproteobacteria bacterium]|nr:hypothetical protein [Gammaproteobacteria bacterium]